MWFKRIALFFILFANTLLLAHSIIPHHHHNGVVAGVITVSHSHNSHNSFNDHSGENDDDCVLREEILLPGRNLRFALNQQDDDQYHTLSYTFLNSIPDYYTSVNYFPWFSASGNYDISQYLFLLNNSQGLRAPPLS